MKEKPATPDLVSTVLGRMQDAGVLEHVVLVGSWVLHFYRAGMSGFESLGEVRTMDMDLMIPTPPRFRKSADLPGLLADLGFIVQRGRSGFMKLIHSEMDVDFLVPERGRGSDKPYRVGGLGITAQPIRFADFLIKNAIRVQDHDLTISVPDPVRFSLHKLIISERRAKPDKSANDRRQGVDVLRALMAQGKGNAVKETFDSLPPKWRAGITKALGKTDGDDISKLLAGPAPRMPGTER